LNHSPTQTPQRVFFFHLLSEKARERSAFGFDGWLAALASMHVRASRALRLRWTHFGLICVAIYHRKLLYKFFLRQNEIEIFLHQL